MNYETRDTYGMYKSHDNQGPGPRLMGADTLIGNDVYNHKDEDLGDIKEIMLDMSSGQVAYAVLSFGSCLGLGEKLFAVPWSALTLDTINKRFILNVEKDRRKVRRALIRMIGRIWRTVHGRRIFMPTMALARID